MNINDLNNKQLVLLTMFVAFVVSIGTGILTAAALQEAPKTVTQTVNRVVERTIERVVTGTSTPEKPVAVPIQSVTKEVTVYAKEDDLVVAAVEKNQPRIVRIYAVNAATGTDPVAIGVIISRDGLVVTDARELTAVPAKRYVVDIGDEKHSADMQKSLTGEDLAFLKISDLKEGATVNAATWSSTFATKVAQSAIVLGGADGGAVFKTTLAKFHWTKDVGTSTPRVMTAIETNPKIPAGNAGGLALNLDGLALGIVTWDDTDELYKIVPMPYVLDLVNRMNKDEPKTGAQAETASTEPQNS